MIIAPDQLESSDSKNTSNMAASGDTSQMHANNTGEKKQETLSAQDYYHASLMNTLAAGLTRVPGAMEDFAYADEELLKKARMGGVKLEDMVKLGLLYVVKTIEHQDIPEGMTLSGEPDKRLLKPEGEGRYLLPAYRIERLVPVESSAADPAGAISELQQKHAEFHQALAALLKPQPSAPESDTPVLSRVLVDTRKLAELAAEYQRGARSFRSVPTENAPPR